MRSAPAALQVLPMKLVNHCVLLFSLLLWLGSGAARAQSCATIPNDPTAFTAVDAGTGLELQAFCVGQRVRFEPRPGRNIPLTLLSYGVLPGAGTTYINASPRCSPPNAYPYLFTPQQSDIGDVTVSELANFGSIPTYYIRTYKVYGTPLPPFTVVPCPNGLTQVTVTDATYDTYTVRVGNGPSQAIARNQSTTLAVPAGAATVMLTGHYAANGLCTKDNTLPIPTLAAPQTPILSRLALEAPLVGGTLSFDVNQLPPGYLYSLQIADGSAPGGFRRVAGLSAVASSVTLTLLSPEAGCYRLLRTDACASSTAVSRIICTLSLTGRSTNNRNQLLLTDAGAGSTYTVTRNGQPLTTFTTIAGGLEDADVQCGSTYTYRVTATPPDGGISVSNPVAITTQSALPPRQPQLLASFNLNNVVVLTPLLATPLTAGNTLRYQRTSGSQPPTDFGPVATTTRGLRDSTNLDELRAAPPCYTVRLTDVCGNASPESPAACPALLTASAADPDGRTANLSWTAFTGPAPRQPAAYTLQRLAADGTVLSTVAVSGTSYPDLTPPNDRQVLRYRLQIGGAGLPAGTFSYSNLTSISRQLTLTIPTAFTPNGDGLNDVLEVKGRYLRNYTFVVVDRNGQEVFRGTQRSEAWDGRIRGHAPVLGAYVWRFQQENEDGKPFITTGSVTILK